MDIIQCLQEIDLGEKQSKIYLALLEMGKAPVAEIAQKSGIERTAAYPYLESLVKMGLVYKIVEKRGHYYAAESPEKLQQIVAEKQAKIQNVLPDLRALFNSGYSKPRIKFYEGRQGMRNVLTNSLKAKEKINLHLVPLKNVLEMLGEEFCSHYIDERVKKKIFNKSLREKSEFSPKRKWDFLSKDDALLREIRHLPSDFKIDALILIYDDIVSMVSSKKEGFGFEIESDEFSQMMKSMFYSLWNKAK